MFQLFKPKKTCYELGFSLASKMPRFLVPGSNPGLDEEFRLYIECGASGDRMRPEMAALQSFACWAGMAVALQKADINERQFTALEKAFFEGLKVGFEDVDRRLSGSVSYDSFWEWLEARINMYIAITSSTSDTQRATKMIVDSFWDFACDGEPTEVLRIKIWQTYETSLLNVAKIISGSRLTILNPETGS